MKRKNSAIRPRRTVLGVLGKTLAYLFMIFVLCYCLIPILWVFLSTFKTNMEVLESPFTWPAHFTLDAYKRAFETADVGTFFLNSVVVSAFNTVLSVLLYSMAAYGLTRFPFRGRNIIIVFFSMTLLIPVNSLLYPIFFIIRRLGLYDTKAGLVLVFVAMGLPMSFFVLRGFFNNLPVEIEEAAYIDGASVWATFFRIVMPISSASLVTVAILAFFNSWNDFIFALTLTSKTANRTLPLALKYFLTNFTYDYPSLFAVVVIIILPCVIVYALLQERITEGIVSSAIKG